MLFWLVAVFTLVPLLELSLLLELAGRVGVVETLWICLFTGALGGWLARREGLSVVHQMRSELQEGKAPGQIVLEGASVFTGGLLLLTPGVATDLLGFALVVPWTRRRLVQALVHRVMAAIQSQTQQGNIRIISVQGGAFRPDPSPPSETEAPHIRRIPSNDDGF